MNEAMSDIVAVLGRERDRINQSIGELRAELDRLDAIEQLATGDEASKPAVVSPRPASAPLSKPAKPEPLSSRRDRPASPSDLAKRQAIVLKAITDLEPTTAPAIRERANMSAYVVADALKRLREQGVARCEGKAGAARWWLTATLDRRAAENKGRLTSKCVGDILRTIAMEPGQWTEERITASGAWDREQVADACGHLLEAGKIELRPDGAYAPRQMAVAA